MAATAEATGAGPPRPQAPLAAMVRPQELTAGDRIPARNSTCVSRSCVPRLTEDIRVAHTQAATADITVLQAMEDRVVARRATVAEDMPPAVAAAILTAVVGDTRVEAAVVTPAAVAEATPAAADIAKNNRTSTTRF